MEFWIDIEDAAGNRLGAGPITTATEWQSTPRLDEAGTFAFSLPASDPKAALLANKRVARCWGIVDGAVTELGAGIIDEIEVEPGEPTMLRVSGPDLLAELAGRTVGNLHVCEQDLVYLDLDPDLGVYKGAVRWLGDNYGATWEYDLPAAHDGVTDSGGDTLRLWREAVVYAEWLYVGHDARFDFARVTLSGEYLETNRAETTLIGQYFDGSQWVDLPDLVDGTRGWVDFASHWATMNQSGDITWTRPADWARCTPTQASGDWFWVRFTVQSGEVTDDIVLREVAVWADVPTTDGVNQIMAFAPETWTRSGYPATAAAKYLELNGESVLAALRLLSEQGGQSGGAPVREHFRLGTGREIDWFSTWTTTGLRAVQAEGLAAEGHDELVLIEALARRRDTAEVATRLYPWSKDGITLALTTRSAPGGYTLSKADGYLEHDAGATAYGRIEAALRFTEISTQQEDSYFIHPSMVANALFDRAVEWLRTRAVAQDYYDLSVTKVVGVIGPGQTIDVVYHEFADGYHAVDIDTVVAGAPLYILAATVRVDGEGLYTVALEVATADRQATDDVGVITSTVEEVRRLGGGAAALWQATFGAGSAGQQVFEGPGIDVVGDGAERTVGLGGDLPLVLHADGSPASEYATAQAACAAAASGDAVELPPGTYAENVTIPAGVTVRGRGPATIISGTVTLGDGAAVANCTLRQDVDQAEDAVCIVPPSGDGEMAYVIGCDVIANNATGAGYAVYGACDHVILAGGTKLTAQSGGVDSNPCGTSTRTRGAMVDSFVVDASHQAYTAGIVDTVVGQEYWVEVEGAWQFNMGHTTDARADAQWSTWDLWATRAPSANIQFAAGDHPAAEDATYDPVDHRYYYIRDGDGAPVSLRFYQLVPTDWENSLGTFTVTVYEVLYSATPYVHGCEIPNAAGRAAAIPLYGDRASWRTDVASGATHADDFGAGDSHHAAVTLGAGSDPALSLSGQELTLADVLTPNEHTAIGDAAPHHAAASLSAELDALLALTGQALDLDTQAANVVLAGPASGAAAKPTMRTLTNDDLPDPLAFKTAASALTISGGAVTATQNLHTITSESGTADDLATITAAGDRTLLLLQATATHTITVKHGAGNISLNGAADFELSGHRSLLLFWNGTAWVDLGAGGGGSGGVSVEEEDGTPAVAADTIKFPNGYLTDNGDGSVSVAFPAGGVVDAGDVTYTPATATDWDGSADPGNADDAFDQLAERITDLEGAGGGYTQGCRVTNSGAQSVASGDTAVLVFDTEAFDTDGIHESVTNPSRLTCQTAGVYLVTGGLYWNGNNTGHKQAFFYLNGADIGVWASSNAPFSAYSLTAILALGVGDYVELAVRNLHSSAINVIFQHFQMQRIG